MGPATITDTSTPAGLTPAGTRGAGLLERHDAFADALGRASRAVGRGAEDAEARARKGAEQLVATAFVQPLLKQLREHSMAAEPFKPTQAEKQFRSVADATLAHDIVRAADLPIVDRLAGDLLRRARGVSEASDGDRAPGTGGGR